MPWQGVPADLRPAFVHRAALGMVLGMPAGLRLRGGGVQGSGPMAVDSGGVAGSGSGPRVFTMGGFVIGFGHSMLTDVVESYSPDKGGWRKEPGLPVATSGNQAEMLHGSIYMMGGQDSRFLEPILANSSQTVEAADCVWPTLDSVWRLDAASRQWLPAPAMFHRRTCFASATVDGRIYVAGGFNGAIFVAGVECFDPRESKWRRLPDLPRPRSAMAMSSVQAGGGSFLVACGGVTLPDGGISDAVDIFDVRKGAWVEGPPLLGGRSGAATASIGHKLYIMGGVGPDGALGGVDIFDIRTLKWERDLSDAMSQPRTSLSAVACGETIVAMGGYDGQGLPVDTVEIYHPSRGWSTGKSLSFARGMMAATLC